MKLYSTTKLGGVPFTAIVQCGESTKHFLVGREEGRGGEWTLTSPRPWDVEGEIKQNSRRGEKAHRERTRWKNRREGQQPKRKRILREKWDRQKPGETMRRRETGQSKTMGSRERPKREREREKRHGTNSGDSLLTVGSGSLPSPPPRFIPFLLSL